MNENPLWAQVAAALPLQVSAQPLRAPIQQRRRRGYQRPPGDGQECVQLVQQDEALRWLYLPAAASGAGQRRAWRADAGERRNVVSSFGVPLGHNQITQGLQQLDARLNPQSGVYIWQGSWQVAQPEALAALHGRVLLLLHGTFSKAGMFDAELTATPQGRALFERLAAPGEPYAAVLAFEHPTLSVSPWINALALGKLLQPLGDVSLDLLCHSRGGLVAAWALQLTALPVAQVVFVGSPLAGTSLAAPDKLRHALDLLANAADAMARMAGGLSMALPLATGVAGLAAICGRVLSLGASTPLADAAVGLVPGLMAQSLVANNLELAALDLHRTGAALKGIGVSFRPNALDEPLWKFWARLQDLGGQLAYGAASMVFDGDNDLVVDTASMRSLPGCDIVWTNLPESGKTHHCNYFRDVQVIAYLDQQLRA